MKGKEWIIKALVLIGALTLGMIVGCPIYTIWKVPCPCCGVTRAWISLFKGDIKKAFFYNPIFIPITILLMLFVFEEKLFKKKKRKNIFFGISGTVVFLLYIVRIWQGYFIF